MGPTIVLLEDPMSFGQPVIVPVAHMACSWAVLKGWGSSSGSSIRA